MVIVKNVFKGKDYKWPTHTNSLIIDRKDTKGSEVFLTTINPQKFTHRHAHNKNEQLYYVIEGAGLIIYKSKKDRNDKKIKIKKYDIVLIPIETEHQVFCKSKKPLKYVTIDVFPKGKPKDEPTWAAHAKKLIIDTTRQSTVM